MASTQALTPGDQLMRPRPVAILDVHYMHSSAVAAGVVACEWVDAAPCEERVIVLPEARAYRPGAFYERELPCLEAVLSLMRTSIGAVVIDGYVVLDKQGSAGLGAHLHARLSGDVAVIGVAKTAFRGADFATPVFRGGSRRPLYVTAAGLPTDLAASLVKSMHGLHRLPTLISRVDRLARERAKLVPGRP